MTIVILLLIIGIDILITKTYSDMTIVKIWFDNEYLYGEDQYGKVYKQSLLWYERLNRASEAERENYIISPIGIHWRELDEDVSFESFVYDDNEPSSLQRFFLTHKEINVAEFAKAININASLLRNYINGFKRPSKEREQIILEHIHNIGKEFIQTVF